MSCFFCDGVNHLSQNCNIYVSDESRQQKAKSKNCCRFCLTELLKNDDDQYCVYCKLNRKCYICFSKKHHCVYCPDRLEVSQFFVPNIDNDLLPRFMQILNLEEYYSLTFSVPEIFNAIDLKRLTIIDCNIMITKNMNSNFLISNTFCFPVEQYPSTMLPPLEALIFKVKSIDIKKMTLSGNEFSMLLSPKVIYLNCIEITFTTPIKFSAIMAAASNIDFINFEQTIIESEKTWPDEIIKAKDDNSLWRLRIPIRDIDFNVKSLVTLIKDYLTNHSEIIIDIINDSSDANSFQKIFLNLSQHMSSDFVLGTSSNGGAAVKFCFLNKPDTFLYNTYFTLL